MDGFTYEKETKKDTRFETYEWDNVWIEHANGSLSERVAYIGDSISCGTRRIATMQTDEAILFDGFGTSKAIDNPYFFDSLRLFFKQLPAVKTVVFNNGLHGWHLEDSKEYGKHYAEMLRFLIDECRGARIFVALTTAVADEERNARVCTRNKAAIAAAKELSLPIIDLYSVTDEHRDMLSGDGVHPTEELSKMVAAEIIANITK